MGLFLFFLIFHFISIFCLWLGKFLSICTANSDISNVLLYSLVRNLFWCGGYFMLGTTSHYLCPFCFWLRAWHPIDTQLWVLLFVNKWFKIHLKTQFLYACPSLIWHTWLSLSVCKLLFCTHYLARARHTK